MQITGAEFQFDGKKLSFYSLKSNVVNYLFCIILVLFLSSVVGLFWSFVDFRSDQFIYDTIKNNIEGEVLFCDSKIDIDQNQLSSKIFDYNSFEQLWEKYNASVSLLSDFEDARSLGFSSESFYSDYVHGFVYCMQRETKLVFGLYPQDDQLLITDYLADGLVLHNEKYTSYDDITEKGLSIDGFSFSVSGIVDTDYEKYIDKYDLDEFKDSQAFIDYQIAVENIYCRLYLPLEEVNQGKVSAILLNNGEYLASLEVIDTFNDDINDDLFHCYVNEFFYSQLNGLDCLKTQCGEWEIVDVIEDRHQTNIVYVSKQTMDYYVTYLFVEEHDIVISLNSVKEVEFLSEHGMENFTSLSGYINQTIDIVFLLQKLFAVILILLVLLLFGLCIFTVKRIINNDLHLIAFMRMCGHPFGELVRIEGVKIIFVFLICCLFSVALYCAVSIGLNCALSSLFESEMFLFSIRIISIIAIIVSLFMCFFVSSAKELMCLRNKTIKDLLKKTY